MRATWRQLLGRKDSIREVRSIRLGSAKAKHLCGVTRSHITKARKHRDPADGSQPSSEPDVFATGALPMAGAAGRSARTNAAAPGLNDAHRADATIDTNCTRTVINAAVTDGGVMMIVVASRSVFGLALARCIGQSLLTSRIACRAPGEGPTSWGRTR